jgi:hypothetical protein
VFDFGGVLEIEALVLTPKLALMALEILTIPAMSAEVERVFITANCPR